MRVLVVALSDLSTLSGTYMRVSGQILSTLNEVDRYYIVSYGLSNELKAYKNITWVKPVIARGKGRLALLASCCSVISPRIASYVSNDLFIQSDLLRKIDIAHLHHLFTAGVASKFCHKVPTIIDIHGFLKLQIQHVSDLKTFLYEKSLKILESMLLKKISKLCSFIVPTATMKEYIYRKFKFSNKEKIYVIPDGIFINEIPKVNKNKIAEIREKIGLFNKIVVTYIGTLSPYHGFYDLVFALNLLNKSLPNLHTLLIIPKGSSRMALKYLRNLSITILENIPRKEIYPFLYTSDVLVIPHRAGTQFEYLYSNKLLDYVASGRPIVGYRIGAVEEFLANYPLKILVEPNNPTMLAKGILTAIEYKDEYVNGIEYVREYDWNFIGRKLLKIYKSLASE